MNLRILGRDVISEVIFDIAEIRDSNKEILNLEMLRDNCHIIFYFIFLLTREPTNPLSVDHW